jgi:FkbM family methyltransferase
MRLLVIKALRLFTGRIQLKGIPKLIVFATKFLFRTGTVYKAYNGIKLKINPEVAFHGLNVCNYGGFEAVKIFEKILTKGDVYVDVGANLGYMSLNAERIVGNGGKVISFEPDPTILPLLRQNLELNQSNVFVIEQAVSDKAGTCIFNIATESGLSRLENQKRSLFGMSLFQKTEVTSNTLDYFIDQYSSGRKIKLIKVDVEGHELRVLSGARSTIQRDHPALLLEINHGALNENHVKYQDILDYLTQFGYEFFQVNSHGADWFRASREPSVIALEVADKNYYDNYPFDLLCLTKDLRHSLNLIRGQKSVLTA